MENLAQLNAWVCQQLQCETNQLQWQPLSGDASFRRYVRCCFKNTPYIAAFAPPATEKNQAFILIAEKLNAAKVHAPTVLAYDLTQGFLLQSDLGMTDLQSVLNRNTVDDYYQKAMQQIAQMQQVDCEHLPCYDQDALLLELSYFRTWFVEKMLHYSCTAQQQHMLDDVFLLLTQSALAQQQAFVHRDYHCRNIMVLDNGELATIDFQDAVKGPITYDLVSVLRDCYVVWDEQQVYTWLERYRQDYHRNINADAFKQQFDWMGLQRHIKVLGIFARLSLRDGKHGYLNNLPTVWRYVLAIAQKYPQLEAFSHWLNTQLLTLVQQQTWGKGV